MPIRRLAIVSLVVIASLTGSSVAPPAALAQAQDPCAAALTASGATATREPGDRVRKYGRIGADTRDVRDLLHLSGAATQARARAAAAEPVRPMADRDENNIAILEDNNGDLLIRPNPFDLANTGLRFEPAGSGYQVATAGASFRNSLGRALTLGDDDSVAQTIAFPFTFYGRSFTSLFINSDGNLTFETGDNASTERGIERLVSGAPRIAPFFSDLDPSVGGRMFVDSAPDAMTVTWCGVPGFGVVERLSVQAVLFPGGAIEFRYGASELVESVVALSPGHTDTFTAVNLNKGGQVGEPVPFGEQFIESPSLDLVAAARRFYQTHPDDFDQLVFFTDTTVITNGFAFESTVQNGITGTGLEVFNFANELGSGGALLSVINMDRISKYPDAPSQKLSGDMSSLGVLAHETGHRWLVRLMFRDANRQTSDLLLGRQRAHWSFFMDSNGSVMEGNDIEDAGGGVFKTVSSAEKFSRLDLYAMGLATAAEVPGWFYVDAPISDHDREDSPRAGVTFNGTRRDVLIQDVIDALGPRVPAAADAPRVHRQAYIFVRRPNSVLGPGDFSRLSRIREEFGPFFNRATENRMTVRTTLPR